MSEIYIISPPVIHDDDAFLAQLDAVLSTQKVAAFQLRVKDLARDSLVALAQRVVALCHEYHVVCIINDAVDIVAETHADGVHIGQDDGPSADNAYIKKLRKQLGEEAIIGVSCYGSKDAAMHAGEQGASYVSFGAFYPTQTKEPKARPPVDILSWWSEYTNVPVCAIGGINPDNCTPLVEAGADFIAVVSYVWDHPEGAVAAIEYLSEKIALEKKIV